MDYISIAPGLTVSRFALGTDVFGSSLDRSASYALMDYYIEHGGNVLDSAQIYGEWVDGERHPSEKTVGRYIAERGIRDKIVISTKGGHPFLDNFSHKRLSREEIISDADSSLLCLGVDDIDLYWLHRDDEERDAGEIIETLNELYRAGKVKYLGASNWRAERIALANEYAAAHGLRGFCASQIQYACAEVNRDTIDSTLVVMDSSEKAYYEKSGMPVFAFSSQGKGYFTKRFEKKLTDGYHHMYDSAENDRRYELLCEISKENGANLTQNALAYLTSQPRVTVIPILGCKRIEQLADSMAAPELRIDTKIIDG
ncbi:MAG: aldo/keto reductase [Eubacteriales bacterium]